MNSYLIQIFDRNILGSELFTEVFNTNEDKIVQTGLFYYFKEYTQ